DDFGRGWVEIGAYQGYGVVEVLGGSVMDVARFMNVGSYNGTGILRIGGGSYVQDYVGEVGNYGGHGVVQISGAGSRWDVRGHFGIGQSGGRGELVVSDGAILNTGFYTWV